MHPVDARMNPDSSSRIYVAGEARAHSRLVENNKSKHVQVQEAKKVATEERHSTLRHNLVGAFERIRQTVLKNNEHDLAKALKIDNPASDFSLALQHLGTKSSLLPDGGKATIIEALVRLHSSVFSGDASPPTFETMDNYDEIDDGDMTDYQVEEV